MFPPWDPCFVSQKFAHQSRRPWTKTTTSATTLGCPDGNEGFKDPGRRRRRRPMELCLWGKTSTKLQALKFRASNVIPRNPWSVNIIRTTWKNWHGWIRHRKLLLWRNSIKWNSKSDTLIIMTMTSQNFSDTWIIKSTWMIFIQILRDRQN